MPAFYMNRKKPWNLSASPYACALLSGSEDYPGLRGKMEFYLSPPGLLITHEFWGLPYDTDACAPNILGLHLHQEGSCAGTTQWRGHKYGRD